MVLYNSSFLAHWYGYRVGPHRHAIVYPPLDITEKDSTWNGKTERVLMIGPSSRKGIDVTLAIAAMDVKRTYIVAGGPARKWAMAPPSNVQFVGWQNDRAALFGSADVVIVPSRWEEPFGRVAIEALRYGCAVLVSNRGGLRESVGRTRSLVVDGLDPPAWLERLNWLEAEPAAAQLAVDTARSLTERFRTDVQISRLTELLEQVAR